MQALIAAIKEALKNDTTLKAYVKGNVFVSPTTQYLPKAGGRSYNIGIVPGSEPRTESPGNVVDSQPSVRIVAWVGLNDPDDSVMGKGNYPGILAMTDDINAVLETKSFAGCEWGFCKSFSEPKIYGEQGHRGNFLVQRILTYTWEKEEER